MPATHFLIVYDLEAQRIVAQDAFGDVSEATRRYAECEREHLAKSDDVEIVLIGADSIDTVRQTHSSYFDGLVGRRSKYLAGL